MKKTLDGGPYSLKWYEIENRKNGILVNRFLSLIKKNVEILMQQQFHAWLAGLGKILAKSNVWVLLGNQR